MVCGGSELWRPVGQASCGVELWQQRWEGIRPFFAAVRLFLWEALVSRLQARTTLVQWGLPFWQLVGPVPLSRVLGRCGLGGGSGRGGLLGWLSADLRVNRLLVCRSC